MEKNTNLEKKTRIAVLGYGNIGKAAEQAVNNAADMEFAGVFHHNETDKLKDKILRGEADVVLVCTPTREVPEYAKMLLEAGACTVDSFDIHQQIAGLRRELGQTARANKTAAVVAAGWDPGSDSVVRCLMQALAPQGLTYTNFGPGRSMGHTVAAKAIKGVKDALSMTIPLGTGVHRRMVYVQLEDGADFEDVKSRLLADDYFAHDETHVIEVSDVQALNNVAHGVNLVRNGVSGTTHNQRMEFNMSINNPALTGQVMVACARAAVRMKNEGRCGAFTLIEVPPVYLLEGDDEQTVRSLV